MLSEPKFNGRDWMNSGTRKIARRLAGRYFGQALP